jgi:hypothetical protein
MPVAFKPANGITARKAFVEVQGKLQKMTQ